MILIFCLSDVVANLHDKGYYEDIQNVANIRPKSRFNVQTFPAQSFGL